MEDFLGAPLAAIRGQGLILFAAIDIGEEEIVFPQDGRFMHLRRLGLPAEPVFQRVLQNPDEYLMPRYAPFEELPNHWEEFSGVNYLGMQQHLQEELDAPEQEEDMAGNEEEDSDDEGVNYLGVQQHLQEELDAPEQEKDMADNEEEDSNDEGAKASSQDVDAKSSASQHVTKRDDTITDDCRLLEHIGSTSSSIATIDLQDPAMPDASPAAFVSVLESVTRIRNPHQ